MPTSRSLATAASRACHGWLGAVVTYVVFVSVARLLALVGVSIYMANVIAGVIGIILGIALRPDYPPERVVRKPGPAWLPPVLLLVAVVAAWFAGEGFAGWWLLANPSDTSGVLDMSVVPVVYEVGVAPILEETCFRGLFLDDRRDTRGLVIASVVSSVAFMLCHESVAHLVLTFSLGMALCGIRLLTGRVWPSVIVHASFNATTLVLAALGIVARVMLVPLPVSLVVAMLSIILSAYVLTGVRTVRHRHTARRD